MEVELTIGDYLNLMQWWQSLPPRIQDLAAQFAPGSQWRFLPLSVYAQMYPRTILQPIGITKEGKVRMQMFKGSKQCGVRVVAHDDVIPAAIDSDEKRVHTLN